MVDMSFLEELLALDEAGQSVDYPNGWDRSRVRRIVDKRGSLSARSDGDLKAEGTDMYSFLHDQIAGSSSQCTAAAPREELSACPLSEEVHIEAFRCPITQLRMRDPTSTPSGHTYDGNAIRRTALELGFSPQTKCRLSPENLIPNRALAEAILQVESFREKLLNDPSTASLDAQSSTAENPEELVAPSTPSRKRRKLQKHDSAPKHPPPLPPVMPINSHSHSEVKIASCTEPVLAPATSSSLGCKKIASAHFSAGTRIPQESPEPQAELSLPSSLPFANIQEDPAASQRSASQAASSATLPAASLSATRSKQQSMISSSKWDHIRDSMRANSLDRLREIAQSHGMPRMSARIGKETLVGRIIAHMQEKAF